MKIQKHKIAQYFAAIAVIGALSIAEQASAQNQSTKSNDKKISASTNGAPLWRVNQAQSHINWETKWAGQAVSGRFNSFDANIRFNSANLTGSVIVNIPANGFNSPSREAQSNLPLADWLNTRAFPIIRFESNSFVRSGPDSYVANGFLTVKGVRYRLALPFRLQNNGANSVIMTSSVKLDRLNLKIGTESDANADWVARDVLITIRLNASK